MHAVWNTALHDCHTAVELGCAFGIVLKQLEQKGLQVHGVDIFQRFLDYVPVVAPGATCECADALQWCRAQEECSWDVVMLVDFIEHVPHNDGAAIIMHAQRIARRSIVLETPKGFQEQAAEEGNHIATPGVPDMFNPHQKHVCGWEVSELEALGFRCVVEHRTKRSVTDHRPYDRITAAWHR